MLSRHNRKRHGIDFDEAQALWDDPELLKVPARTMDEPRYLVIALAGLGDGTGRLSLPIATSGFV